MPALETTFMVIDDSDSSKSGVFAFVGLLVPIEKVDALRIETNRFLRELQGLPERTHAIPPELHGCDMLGSRKKALPWATDEHRLRCYEHVVDIVTRHRLQTLRAAYVRNSLFPGAREKPHGLCYLGLTFMVQPLLETSYVIPMIDGWTDHVVASVGGSWHSTHAWRADPSFNPENISVKNSQNLMDPVFLDSKHSSLMQITDVVAYLLMILDYDRQGLPFTSEYSRGVLAAAKRLDLSLVLGVKPITMQNR